MSIVGTIYELDETSFLMNGGEHRIHFRSWGLKNARKVHRSFMRGDYVDCAVQYEDGKLMLCAVSVLQVG